MFRTKNLYLALILIISFMFLLPNSIAYAFDTPVNQNTLKQTDLKIEGGASFSGTPLTLSTTTSTTQKTNDLSLGNKEVQLLLTLNNCIENVSNVYVNIKGEWILLSGKDSSQQFQLISESNFKVEDITEIKILTSSNGELMIPTKNFKVTEGTDGSLHLDLNHCPDVIEPVKNTTRNTQVHLHLNKCSAEFSSVYLKLHNEWHQLEQQGNSPLYMLWDRGEFVSDDITEFKFIPLSGEEIIIPVSELRIGVEAEGTINYWMERCPNVIEEEEDKKDDTKVKNTQIHLHLKGCPEEYASIFVQLKGEWLELTQQGKSPLYKLLDNGEYVHDDITAFKFITTSNQEIILPIADFRVGIEAEGTINIWIEECPNVNEPIEDGADDDSSEPPSIKPIDESGTDNDEVSGTLPQTGEASHVLSYFFGILLLAAGALVLFWNKIKFRTRLNQ